MRRSLEQRFESRVIHPVAVREFEDSALMKVFGPHCAGLFPAASVISKEIES
jgi:LysR family transcriptional activator of nhaA